MLQLKNALPDVLHDYDMNDSQQNVDFLSDVICKYLFSVHVDVNDKIALRNDAETTKQWCIDCRAPTHLYNVPGGCDPIPFMLNYQIFKLNTSKLLQLTSTF